MSRLEEIKARQKDAAYLLGGTMIRADWNWLIKQAEERNEWKGKHSILKRKYKSLQRKINNRWRANRAIMNESKQKHNVLEAFREENQRYKQALEFYADRSIYNFETETDFDAEETRIINEGHIFRDFGEKARKALEGE